MVAFDFFGGGKIPLHFFLSKHMMMPGEMTFDGIFIFLPVQRNTKKYHLSGLCVVERVCSLT